MTNSNPASASTVEYLQRCCKALIDTEPKAPRKRYIFHPWVGVVKCEDIGKLKESDISTSVSKLPKLPIRKHSRRHRP